MDRMYEDVLAFETALGVRFEWVLRVGDFGVWPDASRVDKATKKHDGAGEPSTPSSPSGCPSAIRWTSGRSIRGAPAPTADGSGPSEAPTSRLAVSRH
jgi:hypothetical protein